MDPDGGSGIESTKKCPRCAEMINAEAVVCRFCGYTYGQPVLPQGTRTNGLAIASLVLGIVWVYGVGSLLALIFGITGKRQIDRSGGTQSGRGLAIAGQVLGIVGLVSILFFVAAIYFLGKETSTVFSCTAQDIASKSGRC